MITRKEILSAMSVMTSMMMFAAGPSDGKSEMRAEAEATPIVQTSDGSVKQAENQAIVRDVMRELGPGAHQKFMQRQRENDKKWREEMIRQAKEREAREKKEREEEEKHAAREGCRKCRLEAESSRREAGEWFETSMALREELAAKNNEILQLKMENEKCRRNLDVLRKVGVFSMAMLGAIIGQLMLRRKKEKSRSSSTWQSWVR